MHRHRFPARKSLSAASPSDWALARASHHVEAPPRDAATIAAHTARVLAAGDDVVALARALVDVNSVSGHEQVMGDVVAAWLEARGWHVHRQPVAGDYGVRHNLHCTCTPSSTPPVYFNTHLDVVPPFFPARVDDTTLYGRGACDTKGLIAAMLVASQQLPVDDVGLLFVVSEETDHTGMIAANELGLAPRYLVVGEPTGGEIMRLQKGILKLRVTVRGVAAHSGYPHLGRSAVHDMVRLLTKVKAHEWPGTSGGDADVETGDDVDDDGDTGGGLGATTVNIGVIKGGQAVNALAEECTADLLFRVVTPPEPLLDTVRRLAEPFADVSVDVVTMNEPVDMTYVDTLVDGYPTGVAAFNTDIPYFHMPQGKAVLYGHGNITDAHGDGEHIELDDLRSLVPAYADIATQLVAKTKAAA
jgi:acetylornithine deacetylase